MSLEAEIVKLRETIEKFITTVGKNSQVVGAPQDNVVDPTLKPQDAVVALEPLSVKEMTLKEPSEKKPRKVTKKRASEISAQMITIMNNLGTQVPLKNLLIEFEINGVGDLLKSDEKAFIKKLEAL